VREHFAKLDATFGVPDELGLIAMLTELGSLLRG